MGKTDHMLEHKLLVGSQGFGIWFLVSELLYLRDLLFSNRCGVAHWLFHGLWKSWLCCRNECLHCMGGQWCCSGCDCQCRLRKYLQGVGMLWMLWAHSFQLMLISLPLTPSFWRLCKHGATIGFDGRNAWKTYDMTEEMDVVPFGAKIFLK